jgi:hypothetical protein
MATIRLKRGNNADKPTSGLLVGEVYFLIDTKQIAIPYDGSNYAIFDIGNLFLKKTSNLSDLSSVATARTNLSVYSKSEVDSMIVGMTWKEVDVASTENLTLSGEKTIDGKACVAGDTVLCKNQTDASENGVYVVASGTWARADFADTASEIENLACIIQEGTTNGSTVWICTSKDITLNTDPIEFVELPGAGAILAGTGLRKSGNEISIDWPSLTTSADPADTSVLAIYDAVNEEHRKLTINELLASVNAGLYKVKADGNDGVPGTLKDKLDAGSAIALNISDAAGGARIMTVTLTFAGLDTVTTFDADTDTMIVNTGDGIEKATINDIIDAATVDGGTF